MDVMLLWNKSLIMSLKTRFSPLYVLIFSILFT